MIRPILGAGLLALAAAAAHADGTPASEVELPVVPASVDPRQSGRAPADAQPPGTLLVRAGETKAIMVSAGNVNRIVTPFEHPDIITTAPDNFTVRQNIIYAAPTSDAPISLYMTEQGDESQAINLILSPRPVASREIRLVMAGTPAKARIGRSVKEAGDWERGQPYENTLTELVSRLAKGGVPQGYDLATAVELAGAPRCAQPAPFRVDFRGGQHLSGGQLEIWIGRVANHGSSDADYVETACAGDPAVTAVALWPSPRLRPAEIAEIYVVRRIPTPEQQLNPRPSLIEVRHGAN